MKLKPGRPSAASLAVKAPEPPPAQTYPGSFKAPSHLSKASRAWWAEVVASYDLEAHHLHLLTLAAEALDRGVQARETLKAHGGLTIMDPNGRTFTHPAIAIERDCRIAFARLLRELDLDATMPAEAASRAPGIRSNRG